MFQMPEIQRQNCFHNVAILVRPYWAELEYSRIVAVWGLKCGAFESSYSKINLY